MRNGRLDVGAGHCLYWECHGNPTGRAVVALHGGPGSGLSSRYASYVDLRRFRVVLFDQRGCGRSTPNAADDDVDLDTNTTTHLIADIEQLRRHLDIDRWLVFGSSWGTTLGLAYAQAHPHRVSGLVLAAVTTTSTTEVEWITRGVGSFLPDAWDHFAAAVPEARAEGSIVDAYHARLMHAQASVREAAARAWAGWEIALGGGVPHPRWADARFRLAFARLVTHYWRHHAWLADGELICGQSRLEGLPIKFVHGRLDLAAPLRTAWELHRATPGSDLVIVERAGHDLRTPDLRDAVAAAIARTLAAG